MPSPSEKLQGWAHFAEVAGCSEVTLRAYRDRFDWDAWLKRERAHVCGAAYGKPMVTTVCASLNSAVSIAQVVIAAEMPAKRSGCGQGAS